MHYLKKSQGSHHQYADGTVHVTEFNFSDNAMINDAEITLTGRYPTEGYAVNDISTALVSVESGSGSITIKGIESYILAPGDRFLIEPDEPYFFAPSKKLVIRYIATPAWTANQARIVQ